MKILAVTDIHGRIEYYKEVVKKHDDVDVIFFAGDIAPYSNISMAEALLKEMIANTDKIIIAVPGNMDPAEVYEQIEDRKFLSIHGKHVELGNVSVIGIGGSPPTPFRTIFEISEEEIEKLLLNAYKNAVSNRVILLSHSPPYNTKCDVALRKFHVGSKSIRKFIENNNPILCVCGHIHESRAIDRIGNTIIVNPGPLSKGYYAIININDSVEVELLKL